MAYRKPVFNLFAAVYTTPAVGEEVFRGYTPCQLRGPGNSKIEEAGSDLESWILMEILFPKGTDVRDAQTAGAGKIGDTIEITPGTGRWYYVHFVDDKGAGFSNEYRLVIARKKWTNLGETASLVVDPEYTPPGGGPWIPPYTGPS